MEMYNMVIKIVHQITEFTIDKHVITLQTSKGQR